MTNGSWGRRTMIAVLFLVAVAAVLAMVARQGADRGGEATPTATREYLPGRTADVYLPGGVASAPVVVLVPGGSWQTADRDGLGPLAESLAAAGIVAVNAGHRAVSDGGRFPQPVADVVCSVAFAAEQARQAGVEPQSVIVVGHSSGGHLAALAALAGSRFGGDCPYPQVRIDGLAGLAGAYDVNRLPELAEPLFGRSRTEAPGAWREGNPLSWVGERVRPPALRILLAHGTVDAQLPQSFTTGFATALRRAGHPVLVELVPGADHHDIYSADVITPILLSWIRGLNG
jgi:acetyl esterase/lipase